MSTQAVRARQAQIRIEAVNESTPPKTVFGAAERACEKVEALLGLSGEQIERGGFVPAPVFTLQDWQANLRKSTETLEAERLAREARDRKARGLRAVLTGLLIDVPSGEASIAGVAPRPLTKGRAFSGPRPRGPSCRRSLGDASP
jgi:hypothetical protein